MRALRAGVVSALFLFLVLAGCGGGSGSSSGSNQDNNTPISATGPSVPGVGAYDDAITAFMRRWNIPGASVAVAKDGKLILARGYGYADRNAGTPAQPDSIYRIASISKTFTSAAILHLVEQGKLSLDDNFLDILTQYQLPPGADQRLRAVTIRNLLQHSGGWDATAYDPMFDSVKIANALHVPAPANADNIIRYMMGRQLDFAPGTSFHYSNFGYCILGRVIEKVTGQSYETYMRNEILAPMGIHAMRIGASLQSGRAPGEVYYHDSSTMSSVFPGGGHVPTPYGGFYLEAMDSHGAWIASAIDLTRFTTAIDGHRGTALLSPASLQQMTARPTIPSWANTDYWYGLGVMYRTIDTGVWSHDGSLPGTSTLMVHSYNGYTWAILLNSRPSDGSQSQFGYDLWQTMYTALGAGLEGSPTDLYTQYPSPELGPSH